MSILDLKRTQNHIVNWIKDYANSAGVKTLVVGLSGGIDSAIVALLCKKTGLPTKCVNMPCHSSGFSYDRAAAFAKEFELDFYKIDLSEAHNTITAQVHPELTAKQPLEGGDSLAALGGLRSCLRAPTLSYFALATNGIIMGTGNRSEDNLVRYFQKYGDGCVDVSPIADLFKSEVYELFAYMTGISKSDGNINYRDLDTEETISGPLSALDIYKARPTADLWGPTGEQDDEEELGITYDEIEWADRENMNNNIVTDETDPARHRDWLRYSMRQREVIAKVHQLEKISRHKYNPNLPVCQVRNIAGLVR